MADSNDKPSHTTLGMDEALETIKRVERAFANRGMTISSSSSLGALFSKVHRLAREASEVRELQSDAAKKRLADVRTRFFRQANHAVRIARAVEEALDDDEAKEAIHRVRISNMNLTDRSWSLGKDALWELDLHRWFKLGNVPVRFEEPDLIVSLGETLGDYAVACKKAHSEKNIHNSFSEGCKQIAKHGRPGIVAFNLDDLTPDEEGTDSTTGDEEKPTPTQDELRAQHDAMNTKFILDNAKLFQAALERGDCDGILVVRSLLTDTCDTKLRTQLNRTSAVWNHGTGPEAKARFNAFLACFESARRRLAESSSIGCETVFTS
ncbi:hypothetical protein [Burkholderia cepacia]|uniref:hypothetical protein n=1 Tax=Burkholderia cepacia TaxID=292 RepID=UPI0015764808|nr:hypothetical protein [Burkholderia cepacia]NTX20852.1 hypothetical protein [Burkholderia cepacia]